MAEAAGKSAGGGLRDGLGVLGLSLTDGQIGQLLGYLDLLAKVDQGLQPDVRARSAGHADAPFAGQPGRHRPVERGTPVAGRRDLLDVGAGAGLPGVVIAICCPELEVTCVDTVAKKAAFIQQVAASLRLPNLRGVHARVESLSGPFDVISSRAFASLADFAGWSVGALGEGGVWLAMKGKHPADEIAALPPACRCFTWNNWPCRGWAPSAVWCGCRNSPLPDGARLAADVNSSPHRPGTSPCLALQTTALLSSRSSFFWRFPARAIWR
jgi:16S rRNA (guanine527-N7)-methyltransferase